MIIKLHNSVVKIDGKNVLITFLIPVETPVRAYNRTMNYLMREGFLEDKTYNVKLLTPKT